MKPGPKSLKCQKCQVMDGHGPILKESVWAVIKPTDGGTLCMACMELELKRDISCDDLVDCEFNHNFLHLLRRYESKGGDDVQSDLDELSSKLFDSLVACITKFMQSHVESLEHIEVYPGEVLDCAMSNLAVYHCEATTENSEYAKQKLTSLHQIQIETLNGTNPQQYFN